MERLLPQGAISDEEQNQHERIDDDKRLEEHGKIAAGPVVRDHRNIADLQQYAIGNEIAIG